MTSNAASARRRKRRSSNSITARASQEWLAALAPLGTNAQKPFLEDAPVLIAIFAQRSGLMPEGGKIKHYYVPESVGIATGFLIAALHDAGLATLTHTPSPMGFLNAICGRPETEKPFVLLVVGYPAETCTVPRQGGIEKQLEDTQHLALSDVLLKLPKLP